MNSRIGFLLRRQPLNLSPSPPHPKDDASLGTPALNFLKLSCFDDGEPDLNSGRLLVKFPILEFISVYLILCGEYTEKFIGA